MLTPEEQLNSAVQGLEQSQQAPVLQSHMMNRGYEQAGIGVASGIAQIPNVVAMGTGIGLGVAGMLSTSAGLDRALGFFDPFTGGMGRHMVGKTLGRRLIGALPGGAFMIGSTMAASYAANRMVEGQQEYVAARQMLRELPMLTGSIGSASILGSPSQFSLSNASASPATVNRFASSINAIGAGAGMDSAMTRNTLSSMAQNGQIDSSSVESVSRSFREGLQTLQRLQKVLQTDLQTASTVYSNMRAGGLSNDQAIAGLRRSGALSAMSGIGLAGVSQLISNGAQTSVSSGMSALLGSNVAMNSLSSAAMMQSNGLLPSSYLQRAGGSIDAVASRMTELQLGVGSSQGAMALMSSMYNPDGSRRSGSRLFSADRLQASNSFMRDLNPYEMADMQEGLVRSQASVVLGRVSAIRANARNSTQADRRQFEFLSSLGIEDPTEQRVYLDSLRNQGVSQFTAAMQETRNTLITSADPSAAMRSEMIKFSDLIGVMTQGMSTNLRTFGRAMLQASESVIRDLTESSRMAVHLNTGGASLASVQQARNEILAGTNATSPFTLSEYENDLNNGEMNLIRRGSNFTGVRPNRDTMSRLPPLARAYIGVAVQFPALIRSSMVGFGQEMFGASRPYNMMLGSNPQNFSDFGAALGYTSASSASGEEIDGGEYMDMIARTVGERYNSETGSLARADTSEVNQILRRRGEAISATGNQQAQRLINMGRIRYDSEQGVIGNTAGFLENRNGLRGVTQRIGQYALDWNYANLGDAGVQGSFARRPLLMFAPLTLSMAGGLHAGATAIDFVTGAADYASESVTAANEALGAESAPVLNEALILQLQHNPFQQQTVLNEYASTVYGKDYGSLTTQEAANVDQMIRQVNPDMARALHLAEQGTMTNNQFAVMTAGIQLNNTIAGAITNYGAGGVATTNADGNVLGRSVEMEEIDQYQDFYVGNLVAQSFTAQSPEYSVDDLLTSINTGANTFGNANSEAAALVNVARLTMPIDINSVGADTNVDPTALISYTEQMLRDRGVTGARFIDIMSRVRTQVNNMPEITNEQTLTERHRVSTTESDYFNGEVERAVQDQRNLGMSTFAAARDSVNDQNVEYLQNINRDSITQLIMMDPILSSILGDNAPSESNDVYRIIADNKTNAERIFTERIQMSRARLEEAARNRDTAEVTRLQAEIDAFESVRSISGAGGSDQSSTDVVQAYAMSRIFGADGRIDEAGLALADDVVALPGVSSMVSLLNDRDSVTATQRTQFRSGLKEVGLLTPQGEITDTLRSFAELNDIELPTGGTPEEALKSFEDQIRANSEAQRTLIENIAAAGPGVVTSSTEEANDQERMRTVVRRIHDEVLPNLITALAEPDRGIPVRISVGF